MENIKIMGSPKIAISAEQKKIMKKHWKSLCEAQNCFSAKVQAIELSMSKECGIPDMEFFMCDNSYVGIGNGSRTMKLHQFDPQ
jgi:hypothetical protein